MPPTQLAGRDGAATRHDIHPPHVAASEANRAAWDRLHDALFRAPAVPTLFPLAADSLRRCARLLAGEGYPVIELLARPLEQLLPTLRDVFQGAERDALLWGVGTMTSREAALRAAELKPDFLVSPAFSRRVLEVAVEAGIPYVPAALTFQDVQDVLDAFTEFGLPLRVIKLCPVYNVSPEYVASLAGCYTGISFCPTGEVTLENFIAWRAQPHVIAPMGARLMPADLFEAPDLEPVRRRLRILRQMSEEARSLAQPNAAPIEASVRASAGRARD